MTSRDGPKGGRSRPVLLEREPECAAIDELITRAAAGGGGGLLLRGPAGIGKSALVAHAKATAESARMRVLSAVGGVLEHGYPFGVFRQLLAGPIGDGTSRATMLTGAGVAASAVFDAGPDAVQGPDAMFGVTYGLFWALTNLANSAPLLVSVDDVQWCDDASLRVLDFLLRRIDGAPVAVVMAQRSGEALAAEQLGAFAELEAARQLEVSELQPLTEQAAWELTRTFMGTGAEATFAAACHASTAGNPFFLTELLEELAGQGIEPSSAEAARVGSYTPRSVSRIVLARLARLGPEAVAIARAVAVLGDHALPTDAADLAGLSRESAVAAVAGLSAAGVLRGGDRLRFEHPLMREVVEADMAPDAVAEQHVQAAQLLAARGRDPELVAAHTLLSPPAGDPVAVRWLRSAARIASERGAPDEAVTLLTRALAEPPPAELARAVLFELGAAEMAARRPQALEHLTQAAEIPQSGAEQAEVALLLARLQIATNRWLDVGPTVAHGLAAVGPDDRELGYALQAVALTIGNLGPGGDRLSAADIDRYSELDGSTPGQAAMLACLAFQLTRAGEPADASSRVLDRVIDHGGFDALVAGDPIAALMVTIVLQWLGRLGQASALTERIVDRAREVNSSMVFSEALASRASTRWRIGALDEAEADARQSLQAEGFMTGIDSPVALATLAGILVDRGAAAEADEIASGVVAAAKADDILVRQLMLTALGRAELTLGRFTDAAAHLIQAGEYVEMGGARNPAVNEWRPLAAEALVAAGRHGEAREMVAPALDAARRSGGPFELGVTLRAAALVEQPVSVDLLDEARAVLAASELRLEYARVLVDLGAALRRAGGRVDSRVPLTEAMELAHLCGAVELRERARTELHAAGGRPRRMERTGVNALTPSEQRVAALAAQGHSNREIAQQLFVSTRTVETQLRNAYGKLGISSRQELSGQLVAPKK